ncbi:MAG: helix-turn-helix domain-containing protein [Chloroflexota bacterium]|jgi:excisionase family DNA binding protein|nr:helix-turn-helix domain-containing protein [Chloroflexota bacterium]
MPRQALPSSYEQEEVLELEPTSAKNDLLTIREVAQRLRVDTTTVRRWISLGLLEAIILPHRGKRQAYRVRRSTLDHLLKVGPSLLSVAQSE